MFKNFSCVDYVIIGAGIVGLSIARELVRQYPQAKIALLEKESEIGLHASGRNSGVLHSGIYYEEASLKARFCLEGAKAMAAYCDEHQLPINRIGKVIVAQKKTDGPVLEMLYQRALKNGAQVSLLRESDLRKIEPEVFTATDLALFSPETAVVDPKAILSHLYHNLVKNKVDIYFNSCCSQINAKQKKINIGGRVISYGHLFNSAGLYADKIAKACGLDDRYIMIPFKGLYYQLASSSLINIKHLIYPIPDMNMPFLGIHFTKSIDGKIYIGPTAIPSLGREQYQGLKGLNMKETRDTFIALAQQYFTNKQGFRSYTHQELSRFIKPCFLASARSLVPNLTKNDMLKSPKVGIRAQLLDKFKRELVMDFVVSNTENETHVLNAVSPAFTSAFSFAKYIISPSSQ